MKATRAVMLSTSIVTSCVLQRYELVDSFDTPATGGSSTAGGGASPSGGTKAQQSGASNGGSEAMAGDGPDSGGAPPSTAGTGGVAGTGTAGRPTAGSGGQSGAGTSGTGGMGVACTTPPELTECAGTCVDTDTDEQYCGNCSKNCGANAECSGGVCGCNAGYVLCSGSCVRLDTEANCGSCGQACNGAQTCSNNECVVCPTGCAVLNAPFTASGNESNFQIALNPVVNLDNATISFRVYAFAATNTRFLPRVINSAGDSTSIHRDLDVTQGWQTFSYTLDTGSYVSSNLIRIELYTVGTPQNPTRVYVDSISVDNNAFQAFDFTVSSMPLVFTSDGSDVTGTVTYLKN